MLVSKIKPCMSKYKHLYCETPNDSLNQLYLFDCTFYNINTCGNSRANNTCVKIPTSARVVFIRLNMNPS